MSKRRVYWDSCVWLGLFNKEADKLPACKYIVECAQAGNIEIVTSTFSLAEVFKTRCKDPNHRISSEYDVVMEDFFMQDFIFMASVDGRVAIEARRLLRSYGDVLKKPQDAIHLATAFCYNVSEVHTFDGTDLKPLSGVVCCLDGTEMTISDPPNPPSEWLRKFSLLDYATPSESPSAPLVTATP